MSDLLKLRRDQLQAFLGDDEDAIRAFELLFDRVSNPYPVGATYVQFPAAETNVIADAFPESEEPAALFGGVWTEQFTGESSIAFRTVGNETTIRDDGRTNGRQEDQMQRITGTIASIRGAEFNGTDVGSGALRRRSGGSNFGTGHTSGTAMGIDIDSALSPGARAGAETRMTNRLIKVWKRTA